MSNLDRYTAYAAAFEETYADDDWSRLEAYFTEDAVYCPDGKASSDVKGRDELLAKLKTSVDSFDRRMGSRRLSFDPPEVSGECVVVKWIASYESPGKPDLVISGTEKATFEGERICRLEDQFDELAQKELEAWMRQHGASLQGAA